MSNEVTINRETLVRLLAAARAALEDLESGLADGTYEDDEVGGCSSEAVEAAITEATALLEPHQ